ncbi:MAG: glycosyltransferase [Chloroflexi bacterium]|nr:glycosyltransferase [Chloroflexota bacterium]
MITVLITAFREAGTIGRALDAFLRQIPPDAKILVVCPDGETTAVIQQYAAQHPQIRHIPDPGKGKPAALNIGLQAAQGEIVVFSDGDVYVGKDALAALLAPLADPQIGAVTGQPVSLSPRSTRLGYWSHLLVSAAHQTRLKRDEAGAFLLCSGYLFAVRKRLLTAGRGGGETAREDDVTRPKTTPRRPAPTPIPEDALAEDAVISHLIAQQGYRIRYAPKAKVYVKYPDSYGDWLRQKVRSAGGYAQDYVQNSPHRMRSAGLEARHGTVFALTFAQSPRELWWTLLLFLARLHLWLLVFWQVKVRKRPLPELWQRVESTK